MSIFFPPQTIDNWECWYNKVQLVVSADVDTSRRIRITTEYPHDKERSKKTGDPNCTKRRKITNTSSATAPPIRIPAPKPTTASKTCPLECNCASCNSMFDSFARGLGTETVCTRMDDAGVWTVTHEEAFVLLYLKYTKYPDMRCIVQQIMRQELDIRHTWDNDHQQLKSIVTDRNGVTVGIRTNNSEIFQGYPSRRDLKRYAINVLHTLPQTGRTALDSLHSLNTDLSQHPGPLISCGEDDRVLLATTNMSWHGYRTLDELKNAVRSHISASHPDINVVVPKQDALNGTILEFTHKHWMVLSMHRPYFDYTCVQDVSRRHYNYRVFVLVHNPCDTQMNFGPYWSARGVKRIVSNVKGHIDANKHIRDEHDQKRRWRASYICTMQIYDMDVGREIVDRWENEHILQTAVSLQKELQHTPSKDHRLFMVRMYRHYHHQYAARIKSSGVELISKCTPRDVHTFVPLKTIDRELESVAYIRCSDVINMSPNVDDEGRVIVDIRLVRSCYPLYWNLSKYDDITKRIHGIYTKHYNHDADRDRGHGDGIHSTWLCCERVMRHCQTQQPMETITREVLVTIQELVDARPDTIYLPASTVTSETNMMSATVAAMTAHGLNPTQPPVIDPIVYDHVFAIHRDHIACRPHPRQNTSSDMGQEFDENTARIDGYDAIFTLAQHAQRAQRSRDRQCSAMDIQKLSFASLQWDTKRPLPDVPKRQTHHVVYLMDNKPPMYFSVINLVHYVIERSSSDVEVMWERVRCVARIYNSLFGIHVNTNLLCRLRERVHADKETVSPSPSPLDLLIRRIDRRGKSQADVANLIMRCMRSYLTKTATDRMFFYTVNDVAEYTSQYMECMHDELTVMCSSTDSFEVRSIISSPVYDLMTHLTNDPSHQLDYTHVETLCLYLHQMGVYVDHNTRRCEPWVDTISIMATVFDETSFVRYSSFHCDFRRFVAKCPMDRTCDDDAHVRAVRRQLVPFCMDQERVASMDEDALLVEELTRIGDDHMLEDMLHFVQSCMAERMRKSD